ncbi:MAG: hypothetical protein N2Z72_06680 [Bacteroidales bacterium]|nr:hypothetical protein [Bacteroidales bacterium]
MHKKRVFLLWIVIFLTSCTSSERKLLTSRIEYDVWIGEENTLQWNDLQRQQFLDEIIKTLDLGIALDENDMPVTSTNLIQYLIQNNIDTAIKKDNLTEFLKKRIVFLRFREKWEYDPKTFYFYKQVLAVSPGIVIPAPFDSLRATSDRWMTLWWIPVKERNAEFDKKFEMLPTYAFVRNDVEDVMNTYDKMSPWFCNLPRNARDSLFERLLKAFEKKQLPFYNMMFQPFSKAEYEHYFLLKETLKTSEGVQNFLHPSFFARIKFIENWEISFNPFVFRKTILAYAPSQMIFELPYDIVKGYKPLFWVVQDTSVLKKASENEYWF